MKARTPRQQTLLGIVVSLAVLFASGVIALVVEFRAVAAGGNSTISEIVWSAWAAQPGAFVAVLVPLVFAAGFLSGHFFWQSKPVYDAERAGVNLDLSVKLALTLRALLDSGVSVQLVTSNGGHTAPHVVEMLHEFARDKRA